MPKIKVDTTPNDDEAPKAKAQASDKRYIPKRVRDVHKVAVDWIETKFPGHGNAILFGIIGLVVALLIFSLGFWRTLVIAALVVAGVAFGQYLDGNPRIIRALRHLINSSDN
jgi:uncharacterized membrane protein